MSDKPETPLSAHTPGPWRYEEGFIFAERARLIAIVVMQPDSENGDLIAAAPDMLAALIQITSRADDDLKKYFRDRSTECAQDYAMAMAAIKKATGSP